MRIGIALMFAGVAWAQAPSFRAERVLPANGERASVLAPGMLVSIYGEHLGPAGGCTAPATGRPGYPWELCGVEVTFGGRRAGLLYVEERQINFQAPEDGPVAGLAELKVSLLGVLAMESPCGSVNVSVHPLWKFAP